MHSAYSLTMPIMENICTSSPALDTTIAEFNRRTRMRKALEESRFDSTGEEETFEQLSDRVSSLKLKYV